MRDRELYPEFLALKRPGDFVEVEVSGDQVSEGLVAVEHLAVDEMSFQKRPEYVTMVGDDHLSRPRHLWRKTQDSLSESCHDSD